jgi:carbon starvation protein
MSAVILLFVGLGMMALGYFVYSKFIAEKIFKLDPDFRTPAHEFEDGVDFVPTISPPSRALRPSLGRLLR